MFCSVVCCRSTKAQTLVVAGIGFRGSRMASWIAVQSTGNCMTTPSLSTRASTEVGRRCADLAAPDQPVEYLTRAGRRLPTSRPFELWSRSEKQYDVRKCVCGWRGRGWNAPRVYPAGWRQRHQPVKERAGAARDDCYLVPRTGVEKRAHSPNEANQNTDRTDSFSVENVLKMLISRPIGDRFRW